MKYQLLFSTINQVFSYHLAYESYPQIKQNYLVIQLLISNFLSINFLNYKKAIMNFDRIIHERILRGENDKIFTYYLEGSSRLLKLYIYIINYNKMILSKQRRNYKQLKIKDRGVSDIFKEAHQQYQYLQFKQQENNEMIVDVDQNQWISLSQVIAQLNSQNALTQCIRLKIYGKIINYVFLMKQYQLQVGFQDKRKQYLDNIWLTYQPLNQLDKLNDIEILIVDLSNVKQNDGFLKVLLEELIQDINISDQIQLKMQSHDDDQLNLVALDDYIEQKIQQNLSQSNKNKLQRIVFISSVIICDNITQYFKQNYKQFKDNFIIQMENELQIDMKEYISILDQIIFKDQEQILENLKIEKGIFEQDNQYLLKISFVFIIPELKMDLNKLYLLCIGLIHYNYDQKAFKESIKQSHNQKEQFYCKIINYVTQFCQFVNINMNFQLKLIDHFSTQDQINQNFSYIQNYIVQECLQDKIQNGIQLNFLKAENSFFKEEFPKQLMNVIEQEISDL
ncbi:hypothetical protein pb186bvf_007197 [Paramecium bursaria]